MPYSFYLRWSKHGHEFPSTGILEIREQFKAGEHVVFGAHVDEIWETMFKL